MKEFRKKYFGSRDFYRHVFTIMLPIMIQNAITNFVNMLDNLMVGRIGTLEMTGVSIANQLLFVYNLCIFGAVSGAGIFAAQYYGSGNHEGVRNTFRFKVLISMLLTAIGLGLFFFGGELLIGSYLRGEGDPADAAKALGFAQQYLRIMMIGFVPFALAQSFSGTLRETEKTLPPMAAGLTAVGVNLVLNYILIFGHFGAPRLGVRGAAIATVISRFTELAIVAGWTLRHKERNPFIVDAFRGLFAIPGRLAKQITLKTIPLMINETMWAGGLAFLDQCYSLRSLSVVSACNISNTFFNVFTVSFVSAGVAVGIIVGQDLGAGRIEEAKSDARKLIMFSLIIGLSVGVVYFFVCPLFPQLYNTTQEVRDLAKSFLTICSFIMPADAVLNASYFIVRSGGKTLITMIFDSGFVWTAQCVPAFFISRFTELPVVPFYALIQAMIFLKMMVGLFFVHKGFWIQNIVQE
ncbi:MAG: MATE family efflux transporter [Lachnospiraceae bacterium]|nr:MATE family efflux transporter [Lachnospiraceae bacterium]